MGDTLTVMPNSTLNKNRENAPPVELELVGRVVCFAQYRIAAGPFAGFYVWKRWVGESPAAYTRPTSDRQAHHGILYEFSREQLDEMLTGGRA